MLCAAAAPKGQLILPEALKTLPLYTLGCLKHPALLPPGGGGGGGLVPAGERRAELFRLLARDVASTVKL